MKAADKQLKQYLFLDFKNFCRIVLSTIWDVISISLF